MKTRRVKHENMKHEEGCCSAFMFHVSCLHLSDYHSPALGMRVLILLLNGVFLGLGAAAPIGPVNVEIARRTIRFGRLAGFLLGCGAVTVDVGYAVVTSFALRPAVQFPLVTRYLSLIGGLFLGYLAFLCLRSAWRGHESSNGEDT